MSDKNTGIKKSDTVVKVAKVPSDSKKVIDHTVVLRETKRELKNLKTELVNWQEAASQENTKAIKYFAEVQDLKKEKEFLKKTLVTLSNQTQGIANLIRLIEGGL